MKEITNKNDFYNMIDKGFNIILQKLEPLSNNIIENDGSLFLSVNKIGDYLFNRQSSSLQLWGSSPITGPSRFKINKETWIHEKSKIPLQKYLDLEISDILKHNLK